MEILSREPTLQASQIEKIRFSGERLYSGQLKELLGKLQPIQPPKGNQVRRQLMTRSLLLSEGMSPKAYAAARDCAASFGINTTVEIYQAAGSENAAIHFCSEPVLLEIQGRLLALLDDEGLRCVMGHELGHFLAHGTTNPESAISLVSRQILYSEVAPEPWVKVAQKLSMSAELTADRFGLLACGGLESALRLSMVVVTGLPSNELNWDTKAYLKQSKALIDYMRKEGETAEGTSHPEHGLRAWAQWLFSETDVYRDLTGLGPGTRRLEDVDQKILEILGQPYIELDDAQVFEEPLAEVQECALAACVLVAHADGEVHETEVEAIERVFEHLVPDWREYLDRESAYYRFQELAPILYASGPRAQRSLFMLLFHVVAADGQVTTEELGTLLKIGDSLGCSILFHRLLAGMLGEAPVDAAHQVAVEEAIPLTAEAQQVNHVLQVFFQRTQKLGAREVTARRLFRLTGEARFTEKVRRKLHLAASKFDVNIEPELTEKLDTLHQLVWRGMIPAVSSPKSSIAAGEAAQRLLGTLSKLRDKLVSGDGRSPSVRLREIRRGRSFDCYQLEGISVGLSERVVELVRGEADAVLVEAEDAQGHEAASRCQRLLIDLQREYLSRVEETGADELYLGTTFISAMLNGYLLRAPLILHNVHLRRTASSISLATPREDSAMANQALLQTMARLVKKTWTESLASLADEAARQGQTQILAFLASQGYKIIGELAELRSLRNRNEEFDDWLDDRIELENCAVLGLFPQSRSDLLHDYDGLIEQLNGNVSAAPLLSSAVNLLPGELKSLVEDSSSELHKIESVQPCLPIIQADPVQRHVMSIVRSTPAMVIDGPPGTGKSQVIVNLICDALLQGKKIAVVCEKRAALDVVVNRMQAEGLRHLLALVHDVKDDRKGLYAQVVDRIENKQPIVTYASDTLSKVSEQLEQASSSLRMFQDLLCLEQSGLTLGQAITLSSGLDLLEVTLPESLYQVSVSQIETLAFGFDQLARYAKLWAKDSLWCCPKGENDRSSFANAGETERQLVQHNLDVAVEARTEFETAFRSASLPLDVETLRKIFSLKEEINSFLTLMKSATERAQAQTLFILLATYGSDSIFAYDRAVCEFEQQLLESGLNSDKATLKQLVQARPALLAMKKLVNTHNDSTLRAASAWLECCDVEKLSATFRQCVSFWQQSGEALERHQTRTKWVSTKSFSDAYSIVRQNLGRWQRFFNLGWWSARSVFCSQVKLNWNSGEAVNLSPAFLAKFESYRISAVCWEKLDILIDLAKMEYVPNSIEEAKSTLDAISDAQQLAKSISAVEHQLQPLSLLPVPVNPEGWRAWGERIEAMLKVLFALSYLTQVRKTVSEQAPQLKLPATVESMPVIKDQITVFMGMLKRRDTFRLLGAWAADDKADGVLMKLFRSAQSLQKVIATYLSLQTAITRLKPSFPWLTVGSSLHLLSEMQQNWGYDFDDVVKADHLLANMTEQWGDAPVLLKALALLDDGKQTSWDSLITGLWAKAISEHLLASQADLTSSNSLLAEKIAGIASHFRKMHQESHSYVGEAVVAFQNNSEWSLEPSAEKGARRTPLQSIKEAMLREARKQRRVMPMRSFVKQFLNKGLLDAMPVWLLSPETMAQLFPREPIFDLVIIDEASQCTVETGLPVLMRAKQVVIAGDEHQMPPSNYFKASADNDESESETNIPLDVMDAESLLVLARDRCLHHRLSWHYRCQFEELIAFSNHAIYEGDLRTIPAICSRQAPAAISWHKVENAVYEDGTNVKEAESVVDLIYSLLRENPESSIGIITFNLKQRRAILDVIDIRCADDSEFAEIYHKVASSNQLDQRPFVKNLENVQGDERDQIIFSLGHAPRQRQRKDGKGDWYVPARFGPLGQHGGERRLNVAASRAKKAIHIVSQVTDKPQYFCWGFVFLRLFQRR
ncbi:AAA domain-containing protein [Amphritea pacifica]|uniref:TerB family tellurite resistance protein n=1 Tax=Amphritea pacifica TaxID=2811233 RepID=A0ABS2WDZ9_9GAMM|nr:AAA domain-containing protein [Amphritea pacifica]MBN0989850.1 TerB family tellurite resistance protein [Amphritea pacifica]